MHFLFIRIKNSSFDIPWALLEMGKKVDIYEAAEFDPLAPVAEEFDKLEIFLLEHEFNCLISYLFVPEISDLCQKHHFPYIGWVYDSPLISLFHPSVKNPCNYLFVFDRSEYEFLKPLEIPHLYYLPMGVNLSRTGALDITLEDEQRFTCDISFIGNLYEDNSYNSFICYFPEDIAAELKLYLVKNLCNWRQVKPWPRLSQKATDFMVQTLNADAWNRQQMDLDLYLGLLLLSRKLAEMDRITVLNALAEHYTVDLYTRSDCSYIRNVQVHQGVDYYTDMNKIFYLSRINLNITLPSIETGMPQRILDIMGSGGFVLTNYQQEIEDYFEIGKDIEVFRDMDELMEKVSYYLSHEEERLQIAMNGYQKVCKCFSYIHQLTHMLEIVKEEPL